MINQNALENVLVDIQFLKDQFMVVGLEKFTGIFDELMMASRFLYSPTAVTYCSDRLCVRPRAYLLMTKWRSTKTSG